MVQFFRSSQIDRRRWDELIHNSPQRIIYAFSWYLDIISPRWEALIEIEDGQYVAVMPLPIRKRWGQNYVQQPYHCQQLGIFRKSGEVKIQQMQVFIEQLQKHYKRVVYYCFNERNPIFDTAISITRKNFVLDLSKPYPEILKNYETERRADLRRLEVVYELKQSDDIEELIRLHRQNNERKYIKTFEKVDKIWLDRLEKLFVLTQKKGISGLYFAENLGKIEAGIWLLRDADRWIYFYNGATEIGRKQNARLQLLDSFFHEWVGEELVFDFESPRDAPQVDTYYKSFGAKPRPYSEISYDNPSVLWKSLRYLWRRIILS